MLIMYVKNLTVKNFKSFKEQHINFEPLSIIVGANASGKSNTIEIFRFMAWQMNKEDFLKDVKCNSHNYCDNDT